MNNDRTEQLIRDAFADQAARAADGRGVLDALRGEPRRRYGLVLATAAVVAVVVAVAAFVVPEVFRRSTPTAPVADQQNGQQAAPPTSVLVVGVDTRGNTDTVVLTQTHADGGVSLVSLPRDTWTGQSKLNQIYVTDGKRPLVEAVTSLTGVRIDHLAIVDMSALAAVADAVGGVPVCLLAATEDEYAGAAFPQGEQVISGSEALAFVRQRHGLPNGDLDRVVRQQAFLRGLATKLPDADLGTLLDAVHNAVETDEGFDLLGFVQALAGATSLHVGTIPTGPTDIETPQGLALEADPAQVREFVAGLAGTPPSDGVPCVN
ncbi:MAG: LCP family protein [Actinophytocola sp.]|uniref:LCP family protein n=1 Tax=Actinophytocola sp. TaxID=1872138 RepID=UPI003C70D91D